MVDIVVFGGDGYIGWPLALSLAATYGDKSVLIVDNFLTRRNSAKVGGSSLVPISSMDERIKAYEETFGNNNLSFRELDNSDPDAVTELFREISPEAVFHLAHQRAAPYSMLGLKETVETIVNNEVGFLNLIWSLKLRCPDCHLIKLGSYGAYAQTGLDVPEGDVPMAIDGKTSSVPVPFPRSSDDFYHITKINDGKFARLAAKKWNLRITDVMQSTVFGAMTEHTVMDPRLSTRFDYDEILGTVVNRFVTQSIAGYPMTVYGAGTQTSGIMVLDDVIKVLTMLAIEPPEGGQVRIVNNNPRSYSINELAETVGAEASALGFSASIARDRYNPRFEDGVAFDTKTETKFIDARITPTPLNKAISESLNFLGQFRCDINLKSIEPTHSW
ncbi:NAD-dependent epimerase/dehydratase family protein [Amaricoccus macauensis]|uniref:NAD-dependent epimerase/dehydratase family protein n=1 Tax=Amaricoccus macauensis TaxID=57001 RepID=UPI003C7B5628